jgi:hypothetical protein
MTTYKYTITFENINNPATKKLLDLWTQGSHTFDVNVSCNVTEGYKISNGEIIDTIVITCHTPRMTQEYIKLNIGKNIKLIEQQELFNKKFENNLISLTTSLKLWFGSNTVSIEKSKVSICQINERGVEL